MKRLTLFASWLAVMLLAARIADAAEPPQRYVSVNGTATIFVQPDEIELNFSVHTFDKDLAVAKKRNDDSAAKVIESVRNAGVEERYVQTTAASSEAVYDQVNDGRRWRRGELQGYTVQRSYVVRVKDLSRFDALLDKLLVDEAVSVLGHTFRSSESRKHRDDARAQALRAAREKATAMAQELDCTIGPPISISEADAYRYSSPMDNSIVENRSGETETDAPVQLGQIRVRSSVAVVFELAPRDR